MSLFKAKYITLGASILAGIYGLLIYFIFQLEYALDFPSFYSAAKALVSNHDPYQILFADYFPIVKKLSPNLNPPITLLFFTPLTYFNYFHALFLWLSISLTLGFIGLNITVKLTFSPDFIRKNKVSFYLFYLAFFPTLMNIMMGQLGTLILFFIMLGYYFYTKKNDYFAGILWGIIISMKIFPAFLFLYILTQKRYKNALIISLTFSILWFFPYLIYGKIIYQEYFSALTHALWYGDSWNGSIYGFIFRLFTNFKYEISKPLWIQGFYIVFLITASIWYLKQSKKTSTSIAENINHQPFCLALVMMLILSPLGWLYYFPLLIFPLLLSWVTVFKPNHFKYQSLWLLAFFFLNFPMDYLPSRQMFGPLNKIGFNSFYFYGLLILAYLIAQTPDMRKQHITPNIGNHLLAIVVILSFGLSMPIISLLSRLLEIGVIF